MNIRKGILTAALATTGVLLLAAPATAATPAPGWTIHSFAAPTSFSANDSAECLSTGSRCDAYQVTATNAGSQPTDGSTVTLTDTLPSDLTVQVIAFFLREPGKNDIGLPAADCNTVSVQCHFSSALPPDASLEMIIAATVEPGAESPLTNQAIVSGGGAPLRETSVQNPLDSPPPFGLSAFGSPFAGLDGALDTQAGAHPYELTTRIDLNNEFRISPLASFEDTSVHDVRDVVVDLPLGLAGSALSASTCTLAQLSAEDPSSPAHCPPDSQVGHIFTQPQFVTSVNGPIYNLVPERGVAAEFGYTDVTKGSHVLYASLAPTPAGYVLRTTSTEIPQIPLTDIVTSFYGDPAARDAAREQEAEDVPTFANSADCSGEALLTQIHADSWQAPGARNPDGSPNFTDPNWASATSESPAVTGCNQLHFKPTIEAKPETNLADSPTGLDVTLKVPQTEGVETLATPPLKKAVVTLPEGMTVNPSSANGLQGCSLADLGMSASGVPNAAPPHCPDASKIGSVELETPALEGVLEGEIYVAKQTENPFGTLLAIYIVINDPTTGVVVKLPGEVRADPETGQLTTVVDQSPQFPFSELRTHFFGGTKAALRTPALCGTYKVTSSLTPWSAPESGPPATPSSPFKITQAASGEQCPETAAEEPHSPSFQAGTLTPTAGLFSPFVLHLRREDGSQELKGLNVTLPEGLIGKLAGIAECSEAQLAQARAREREGGGTEELANPSCPQSSEVGTVTVGAGAGLTPYYTTGKAYLAGPYKGAPLSLAIITPAVAGPYDLGDVLVRTALQVNPETAQITAKSDPLPTILDGIPLDLRSIALDMSRNQFTLNPTSCERKEVKGEALSVLNQVAPLSNPFQVGECAKLGFKPKLALSVTGPTKRAGNPALRATLTYPKKGAYANIAKAAVTLPHSEFLDNAHIKTICTRVQFAEGQTPGERCPPGSVYGHARAITPLLDQPLEGPVYLRSSSHELPDLVAALNGQIQVVLDGTIDSVNGGIRNRFEVVPDALVTKFTLSMQGGKKGLLENSTSLCAKPNRATVKFTAQNGKIDNYRPVVTNSCKRKAKKGKGKHHRRAG
jgi:hypothetical protein